jgi:hypothetical protein
MRQAVAVIWIMLIMAGCKKPYNPPVVSSPGSYLVVEGVINSGSDSTMIKLSKTVKITSKTAVNPVLNAILSVESNQNDSYALTEKGNGIYFYAGLNLNNNLHYRLRIKTADGQQYLSDFEPVQITPPIDSLGYSLTQNGLHIYVNSHNPANNTRYYRWDYEEEWQFHADYSSQYDVQNGQLVLRQKQVYNCFSGDTSSTIILGSSAKLKQDIIFQQPITDIAATSEKLETRYSIQVKEYGLTGEAFAFWTNLKKNTEQLGSIFDAQPSEITGNIHCISNPGLAVIGYVSVSQPQTKRIFISNSQLPTSFFAIYPYNCELDTLKNKDVPGVLAQQAGYVYFISPAVVKGATVGYLVSSPICSDCTLRGTTKQPDYWKN